jgi:hypothetical protein
VKLTAVALEDVADVRQYVGKIVARRYGKLSPDEQDEVSAEAVAIVYALHAKWDRARCPSFANFCSTYVPLRLTDWWRQEMRRKNGSRRGDDGEYVWAEVLSYERLSGNVDSGTTGRKRTIATPSYDGLGGIKEPDSGQGGQYVSELKTRDRDTPDPKVGEVTVRQMGAAA